MKYSLLAFFLFMFQIGFTQNFDNSSSFEHKPIISNPSIKLSNELEVRNFALSLLTSSATLELSHQTESLTGHHFGYNQFFQGIEVLDGRIDIHTKKNGEIILVQNNLKKVESSVLNIASKTFENASDVVWTKVNNRWIIAVWRLTDPILGTWHLYYNEQIIDQKNTKLFNHLPDSLVNAKVFLINPLQSAERTYGSPYIDSNDLDVPQLIAQQKWVTMRVNYTKDSFLLKTDRYFFGEVSDPVTPKTFSLTNTFDFPRSHASFEDVNAFYHITNYSNRVTKLGFSKLLPSKLKIDAHAYNNGELSSFNYEVDPLELEFGEGGVDDAEDGEVVVHEFAHALSYSASPKTVKGNERAAMEEGNCDYFSTSYSRSFSDYGWKEIFNWDGHNPFWDGILTGVQKTYPQDLTGGTNADRQLWSTPLMCMYERLGQAVTDTLVMEHLFYQTKNTTMAQMAKTFLTIDTLIWRGKHYYDIKECFAQVGMMQWGLGIDDRTPQTGISILNTIGFSYGTGSIEIRHQNTSPVNVVLYDLLGREIESWASMNSIFVEPFTLRSGIYILRIEQNGVILSDKIIKN